MFRTAAHNSSNPAKSIPLPEESRHFRDEDRALWDKAYADALAQTGDPEKAAQAAWGALRKQKVLTRLGIKSTERGAVVGGWGMLFTSEDDVDLDEQFFDEQTATLLEFYKDAPLFMEHDGHIAYELGPIGQRLQTYVYPRGIYVEHVLFADHSLYTQVIEGIESGELCYSSDTMGHYAEAGYDERSGYLGMWPIAAWSLTKNPAEPALGPVTFKQTIEAIKRAASRAREARGAANNSLAQRGLQPMGKKPQEEKLSLIAEVKSFLQLAEEATPEDVVKAFKSVVEDVKMMADGTYEAEGEAAKAVPDPLMLRQMLGLAEDAGDDQVVAALQTILDQMAMAVPGMEAKSYNFEGLSRAAQIAAKSAPPRQQAPPYNTGGSGKGGEDPAPTSQQNNGSNRTAPNGKSRNRDMFNVNKGAKKPGLVNMLRDLKAGKAVSYQTGPNGGYLLNHEVSTEVIPLLQSKLVFDQLGVQYETFSGTESFSIPKMTADAEAYWVGEGEEIPETDVKTNMLTLYPRGLAARVPIPNKYLENTVVNYEQVIRERVTYRIKRAIERAGFFGSGAVEAGQVGPQPLGLLHVPGVTKTALNAVPGLADLSQAILRVEEADVDESDSWGWVFSPRTKDTFTNLTDLNGQPLIRQDWTSGPAKSLLGLPYHTTTIIPNNSIGASDSESYIFLGDWQYMVVGIGIDMEFMVNPYRLMHRLMTEIIAYTYVDIVFHYPEAFEALTDVRAS